MKVKYWFLGMFLICSSINMLEAQDFKADMRKIMQAYNNTENFVGDINVQLYTDESQTPIRTIKANQKKSGKDYLCKVDDITYLLNKKYAIIIDSRNRVISYTIRSAKSATDPFKMSGMPADSLFKTYDKVEYKGEESGLLHYVIICKKYVISKAEIYIDKKTNFFAKTIYYYNTKAFNNKERSVITFNNVSVLPISKETFSESQFIIEKDGKLMPSEKYKNYELVRNDLN